MQIGETTIPISLGTVRHIDIGNNRVLGSNTIRDSYVLVTGSFGLNGYTVFPGFQLIRDATATAPPPDALVSDNLSAVPPDPAKFTNAVISLQVNRFAGSVDSVSAQIDSIVLVQSNTAPSADAGSDQSIRAGSVVTLSGQGSFDDNTAISALQFSWRFVQIPSGSAATLSGSTTANPTFVADLPGNYVIELIVTDEGGLASEPDQVAISTANLAPTAAAGADQLVIVGNTVTLSGVNSTDPENDPLTFEWLLAEAPAGATASLSSSSAPSTSFVPDVEGTYEVTLTVSDTLGSGAPDTVSIVATTAGDYADFQIVTTNATVKSLTDAQVTTKGNQSAFSRFITNAVVDIQNGDVAGAIDKLQKALARTDGCILRGTPDGNGPDRDWITDCAQQATVYAGLNDALNALTP